MPTPKFNLEMGSRKPANKLEKHLLTTAKAWSAAEMVAYHNGVKLAVIDTVAQFFDALVKERKLYCLDNPRSKEDSIWINFIPKSKYRPETEDYISVRPSVGDVRTTFTISLSNPF